MSGVAIFLSLLAIIGIVVVSVVYHIRIVKTQKMIKDELRKLTSMINSAQLTEFNFDKQNEANIRRLDQRLRNLEGALNVKDPISVEAQN